MNDAENKPSVWSLPTSYVLASLLGLIPCHLILFGAMLYEYPLGRSFAFHKIVETPHLVIVNLEGYGPKSALLRIFNPPPKKKK